MKQLKLILTVKDSDGTVKFHKDGATPQDFVASLNLFGADGISVIADIVEVEIGK